MGTEKVEKKLPMLEFEAQKDIKIKIVFNMEFLEVLIDKIMCQIEFPVHCLDKTPTDEVEEFIIETHKFLEVIKNKRIDDL